MRTLNHEWARAFQAWRLRSEVDRAIQDGIVTAAEIRRWLRAKPRRRR